MDLAAILRRMGHQVVGVVGTGEAALQVAERERPDLALMDIMLRGDLDGVETANRMRTRWDVPVVYLTAYSTEAVMTRARATEPYGYLHKPFNDRDLHSTIEMALYKHQMEARLRQSERWLQATLRSIGDAVIACDAERCVTFMNGAAERLTGWTEAEARGRPLDDLGRFVQEADGTRIDSPALVAMREGRIAELGGLVALERRDGTRVPVADSAAPIHDVDGALLGVVVVLRDVTESRRQEARLALANRLASLGAMTGAMAHEVNNPLTWLMGNLGFARDLLSVAAEQAGGDDPLARPVKRALDALAQAHDGAERIRRVVADMREFARPEERERVALDVGRPLQAALRVSRHELRHRASLHVELDPTPPVLANEAQLEQVFVNLLLNAAGSFSAGSPESNVVTVRTKTDREGWATVEIADNGRGISPDALARIFEPFYSTRPVGASLGMGLPIAHGIVRIHGGEIHAESTPGLGSVFRVRLPPTGESVRVRPALSAPAVPPLPRAPGARPRVLVVDDEPLVLEVVQLLLEDLCDVATCATGREALARIAAEPYDAILCDLIMPDVTGMDVYEQLERSSPDVARRVIFVTGGAFTERAVEFLARVPNPRIDKPVDMGQLQRALDQVVGAPAPPPP